MTRRGVLIVLVLVTAVPLAAVSALVLAHGGVRAVPVLAGVAVLMLGMPAAVMLPIGAISGWSRLARAFPGRPGVAYARLLTSVAVRWRALGYNNVVEWAADDDHLHLRIIPPFHLGHPPLSIPWAAVTSVEAAGRHDVRLETGVVPLWVASAVAQREIALRRALDTLPTQPGEAPGPALNAADHRG
ncbi:MAG: hypothetical protein IBJ11_07960 [Phycisphaerales bacterium]|nr:hypothetical protein [Phycisphaerales bacterium]